MLLAHALMRLPMTSAAPGSTLVAGDDNDGALIGFTSPTSGFGDPSGSISPNPVGGFTVAILGDYSGVYLYFAVEGDQVGALAGKTLIVGSSSFAVGSAAIPPSYDGSALTVLAWSGTYGFVGDNSYTVNIV